jgi:hypothetical protein
MFRQQNAGKKHNLKISNRTAENEAKFKHFGAKFTNQNLIHQEIKSILISGNACYHSVKILLCSRLLSKNAKIKIYKTIILPVFFMGVKLGL